MKTCEIILSQLGGHRFLAMTGSKNLVDRGDGLSMTLTKNASKANRLKITLLPSDTYEMEFIKFTPYKFNFKTGTERQEKWETVKKITGVYCDMLQDVFEKTTGLYIHL